MKGSREVYRKRGKPSQDCKKAGTPAMTAHSGEDGIMRTGRGKNWGRGRHLVERDHLLEFH